VLLSRAPRRCRTPLCEHLRPRATAHSPSLSQAKYIEAYEDLLWLRAHLPKADDTVRWPSKEQHVALRLQVRL